MKEIITVDRVEEGTSGTSIGTDGKKFDYTPYNVFSSDGRRFSTFKKETANKFHALIGKQGEIVYNVVPSKDGTKKYLNIADSQKAKQEAGITDKLEEILTGQAELKLNQEEIKRLITAGVKPCDQEVEQLPPNDPSFD